MFQYDAIAWASRQYNGSLPGPTMRPQFQTKKKVSEKHITGDRKFQTRYNGRLPGPTQYKTKSFRPSKKVKEEKTDWVDCLGQQCDHSFTQKVLGLKNSNKKTQKTVDCRATSVAKNMEPKGCDTCCEKVKRVFWLWLLNKRVAICTGGADD